MIDEIMNGVSVKLYELFGNTVSIEVDELPQGFKPPGFWILELKTTQNLVIRNRYRRQYNFDIQYFPKEKFLTREINSVTDTLLMGLEYITVGSNLTRGTNMSYEVQDDVLHFFITFDVFVEKVIDKGPLMEELIQKQHTKG